MYNSVNFYPYVRIICKKVFSWRKSNGSLDVLHFFIILSTGCYYRTVSKNNTNVVEVMSYELMYAISTGYYETHWDSDQ